jgi:hypothetical protein
MGTAKHRRHPYNVWKELTDSEQSCHAYTGKAAKESNLENGNQVIRQEARHAYFSALASRTSAFPAYKPKTLTAMSHKLEGSGTDFTATLSMVKVE